MPLSEKEEFELLSLESEKAQAQTKKPAAAAPKDLLPQVAEEEPHPNLVQIGSKLAAPFEKAGQLIDSARGKDKEAIAGAQARGQAMEALGEAHPLSRITGAGADVALGAALPAMRGLGGAAATGAAQAASQPVTEGSSVTGETGKQAGKGAAFGGMLQGLFNMVPKSLTTPIMKVVEGFGKERPMPAVPKAAPAGAGAEKVTGELQGQRNALETGKLAAPPSSEAENIVSGQAEITSRLPKIFAESKPVSTQEATKALEQAGTKALPDMQKALDLVKSDIKAAIEKSGGKDPTSGMTSKQRAAWGDFLTGKDKKVPTEMSLEMADEVRQRIQQRIDAVGPDKLPANAQAILKNVRDALTNSARTSSPGYGKYLEDFSANAQAKGAFEPGQSVFGKLTSAEQSYKKLTGTDAQAAMEKAFSGPRSERDLAELVAATKHSPEASAGLRDSFSKWLMPKDALGEFKSETVLNRWQDARGAVEKSGLFAPDHFQNIEKLMADLTKSQSAKEAAGTVGKLGGLSIGLLAFHPIAFAHYGKQVGERLVEGSQKKQMEGMLQMMTDPAAAALLNKPPTPANVSALEKVMSKLDLDPSFQKTILNELSKKSGEEKVPPRRRAPDPLSMRPAGI